MKYLFLILLTFLTLASVISEVNGANILFYMCVASYSHRAPLEPLMDNLADRGHNVTFISALPAKSPNPKVNEFNPPKITNNIKQLMQFDIYNYRKNSQEILVWLQLPLVGVEVCKYLYTDFVFMSWMNTSTFDIVIVDSMMNECAYGLVYHFNAKLISFGTAVQYPWLIESHFGLPVETSSIPDGMTHMSTNMNFLERTVTALTPLMWKAYRELWLFPKLEKITRKGLALKEIPRFVHLEANTSLVFVNSHWATEYPRSYPPNVVPVGGIAWHGKGKPLPKKLEDFINKGNWGFIYVSFGTVLEFTRFDAEIRQAFVNTLFKFPSIQFILKSTFSITEKLPENVLVDKWLPQKDILAHPKINAFITHGGLGGVYESILSKVPMICFPMFAEQDYNANSMVEKGYGIKLDLVTLKEEQLTNAITQIINDTSYKRNVEKVSRLFTDRPLNPLETAVWWVEFVLRNPDSVEFLRPLSARQSWWVRRQLDVWAFVFIVATLVIMVPFVILFLVVDFLRQNLLGSVCSQAYKNKNDI